MRLETETQDDTILLVVIEGTPRDLRTLALTLMDAIDAGTMRTKIGTAHVRIKCAKHSRKKKEPPK